MDSLAGTMTIRMVFVIREHDTLARVEVAYDVGKDELAHLDETEEISGA
jgi:hypothetical protein